MDLYVIKEGKNLRCGYTTGSCAAAASKASVYMLENQKKIDYIKIDTPAGIVLKLKVVDPNFNEKQASCAIIKDGGDDPDVTDGIKIYAQVRRRQDKLIKIDGGEGIGRISRKSAFGEIGSPAINKVPREMINREVRSISSRGYDILIYAPEGRRIAKRTYNKNIGIEGGISIIGTKGIVYPMSDDALLKTIYMEVDVIAKEYGKDRILLVPGNYGISMSKEENITWPVVKISNYIGDSLLYIYNKGFRNIGLLGHIGKFSKLSIGIFNTHSKVADARLESFIYYLAIMGAPRILMEEVLKSLTAEEALNLCIKQGYGEIVELMEKGSEDRIKKYLKDEDVNIRVKMYSMERGFDIC